MKAILVLMISVLLMTPYAINGYKFAGCDFEGNYKCEAIHGVGVIIPPASYVTVWFGDDRKEEL